MAQSSLPPPPPTGGRGPMIGALIAILLLGGGFAAWKCSAAPEHDETAIPEIPDDSDDSELQVSPPPPPPPPLATASAAPEESADPPTSTTPKNSGAPASCSGTCSGTIDAAFRSALRQKAGLAKGCYNRALRQNSQLKGKMTVTIRVSPSGTVCSAGTASDSLGDPSVRSCILQKFRAGRFPKPRGGCVDAQVPLNFVANQ